MLGSIAFYNFKANMKWIGLGLIINELVPQLASWIPPMVCEIEHFFSIQSIGHSPMDTPQSVRN